MYSWRSAWTSKPVVDSSRTNLLFHRSYLVAQRLGMHSCVKWLLGIGPPSSITAHIVSKHEPVWPYSELFTLLPRLCKDLPLYMTTYFPEDSFRTQYFYIYKELLSAAPVLMLLEEALSLFALVPLRVTSKFYRIRWGWLTLFFVLDALSK